MDVNQLRAFVAVARARRFTRAARQLGTSQPNLSRRLQQLEREVGARLVVRTPAGVVLTSAGERFLSYAESAIAAVDAGRTALEELGDSLGAPWRSAASRPSAPTRCPRRSPAFTRSSRASSCGSAKGSPRTSRRGWRRESSISGCSTCRSAGSNLATHKLWQEDYLLAVPAGHRLATSDRAIALGEAATEPLVVVDGVASTAALVAACEERGARPRIVVEADNLEAVRRMVERGVGIALLPRIMAEAAVSDRMRTLEIARGGIRRQVALVHRGEAYLTGAARALRTTLVAVLTRRRLSTRPARGEP